jgi:hypothetical protein
MDITVIVDIRISNSLSSYNIHNENGEVADPAPYSTVSFQWNGFLENSLHKLSYELLAHTVFDREFQGLSKALSKFNLAIRLC